MNLTSGSDATPIPVSHLDTMDSFRTLGVYLSPLGSQKRQIKVYLCPCLIYPLLCSYLTQHQCRHVQAPALAARLPKLHLNRHTSHLILFGDHHYGGVNLPDLYTDQGFGQLKPLVGHLKMRDEVGELILIDISHLQLHMGSRIPFFALLYPHYSKWVDNTWLTSIWKHTHQLHITVEFEHHWTEKKARQFDLVLIDAIIHVTFPPNNSHI